MSLTEKEGEILRRSNMAVVAKDHLGSYMIAKRERILGDLLNMYRESKFDLPTICGKLGALSVVEDYLNAIERDITKAKTTEKKLYESPN